MRSRAACLASTLVLVAPGAASAFDVRGHVYIANETLGALANGAWASVDVRGFGPLPTLNDEAALALRRFPAYFRAGALGPDVFPDPVVGRADGHANRGNRAGLSFDQCRATAGCVPGGVPFEERTLEQWRPVDHGMLLLRRAARHRRGERSAGATDERLQAIAFAYGYLGHLAADGFGAAWAGEWADPGQGDDGGALFGALTRPLRRLAVEAYLGARLPAPGVSAAGDDESAVSIPTAFIGELYRAELGPSDGLPKVAPAGSLGGPFLVRLLELRSVFGDLADSSRWRYLGRKGWPKDVVSLLALLAAIGPRRDDPTDPVRDLEGYFESRRAITDELIDGWIRLSGCVAENLVRGATRDRRGPLRVDACAPSFEAGPGVSEVFRGALDQAAHQGADDPRVDLGSLAVNVEKQRRFAAAVSARVLELGDAAAAGLDATVGKAVLRRVIHPRADALDAAVQATYLGPVAAGLVGVSDDAARVRHADGGRSLVSLAYLSDDLKRDPGHAGRLLGAIAGVACAALDPSQPLEQAIGACYERTVKGGVARLQAVVEPAWGSYDMLWRGLVELLLRLAADPAAATGDRLRHPTWAWLSRLRFRDPTRAADSAVSQLVSLLDVVDALSAVRGPTEQLLERELAASGEGARSAAAFPAVRNAIELGKLGLLGRDGLASLGKVAGLSVAPFGFSEAAFTGDRHRPSAICAEVPHLACDAAASLDDPGAPARPLAAGSDLDAPEAVDPERSYTVWRPADPRAPGRCSLGLTGFVLAGRAETVRRIYGRVVTYPERCRVAAVVVESISHDPPAVEPGHDLAVRLTVANVGQTVSAATSLRTTFAGRLLGTHAIPALEPGQGLELVDGVRVEAEGTFEVSATLEGGGQLRRHDVSVSEVPDLAVSISHSGPGLDGTLVFTATIRNLGKGKAAPTTLLYRTPAAPDGDEKPVPALAPGASFRVDWSTVPILRFYSVYAVADARRTLPERDRANNEASDTVDLARDQGVYAQVVGAGQTFRVDYEHAFLRGSWLRLGVGGRPPVALLPVSASLLLPIFEQAWDIEGEIGVGGTLSYVADDVAHGPFGAGLGVSAVIIAGARLVVGDLRLRAVYNLVYHRGPGPSEQFDVGAGWVF